MVFPKYIWEIPNSQKKIYLTFDDGPTPEITSWVLELLEAEKVKATFFCIGKNIEEHPELFQKVIRHGHAVGNHTFSHLKGWDSDAEEYINNVAACERSIEKYSSQAGTLTKLFRPPYGKIKPSQSKKLRKIGYKIIMWDVLSMDFDRAAEPEKCLGNVIKNTVSGSIIVFHDSLKASKNLQHALPKAIEHLKNAGFVFEKID